MTVLAAVKNWKWEGVATIAGRLGLSAFDTRQHLEALAARSEISRRVGTGSQVQYRVKPSKGRSYS